MKSMCILKVQKKKQKDNEHISMELNIYTIVVITKSECSCIRTLKFYSYIFLRKVMATNNKITA